MTGSTETAQVLIHDEAARRVITSALWERVRELGDPTNMDPHGDTISNIAQAALG
jgi:hypothetical protein